MMPSKFPKSQVPAKNQVLASRLACSPYKNGAIACELPGQNLAFIEEFFKLSDYTEMIYKLLAGENINFY